jgi:hypothetical protein
MLPTRGHVFKCWRANVQHIAIPRCYLILRAFNIINIKPLIKKNIKNDP